MCKGFRNLGGEDKNKDISKSLYSWEKGTGLWGIVKTLLYLLRTIFHVFNLISDVCLGLPGSCSCVHLHLRPRNFPRVSEGRGHGPASALPRGCPRDGSSRYVYPHRIYLCPVLSVQQIEIWISNEDEFLSIAHRQSHSICSDFPLIHLILRWAVGIIW